MSGGIVIVGASIAGLRAAEAVRAEGYEGPVTVLGAEAHQPYERPPLSKQLLAGDWDVDRVQMAGAAPVDVEIRLGVRAAALDLRKRRVVTTDGPIDFDGLVIATGATPRTIAGADAIGGVYTLRTLDDCLALRDELDRRPRVAVVGAGFIGAEVAATCRGRGLDVTVIEPLALPLEVALGPLIGRAVARLHLDHGAELRLGTAVAGFDVDGDGRVARLRCANGTSVDTDVVIVGVGVVPQTRWLEGSGLVLDNGVVCDASLLTAPGVVAAGDVARWHHPGFGEDMRVEHWETAAEMGTAAGRRLLANGVVEPFAPLPYVWSDQYDVRIQVIGRTNATDETAAVRDDEGRFAVLYGRRGILVGCAAWNWPRQLGRCRRLISDGVEFEAAVSQTGADTIVAG